MTQTIKKYRYDLVDKPKKKKKKKTEFLYTKNQQPKLSWIVEQQLHINLEHFRTMSFQQKSFQCQC